MYAVINLKFLRHLTRHSAMLIAAIALTSCANKQSTYHAQSYNYQKWAHQARNLVEKHRGVDLSNVTVSSAAGQGMLHVLFDLNRRQTNPNTPDYLKDQAFHKAAVLTATSTQAIYDPYRNNIVINLPVFERFLDTMAKKGVSKREAALTVLIHEMIHAADDIQYNLVELSRRHRGDKLGAIMVREGHAELQTEYICARAGCLKAFFTAHEIYTSYVLNDTASATPAFVNSDAFVYIHGLQFLKSLERKDPTGSLVNQALRHPPGEALEFFDAASYPDLPRADRRASLYDLLETVELTLPGQATRVPNPVANLADLPNDRSERQEYIARQRTRTLASAGMSYYYMLDPQRFTSVKVELIETANNTVANDIAGQMGDKIRGNIRGSQSLDIGISTTGQPGLSQVSNRLPENTQRIVHDINYENDISPLRFYTSLMVVGRYLIKVENSNNNDINKHVLQQMMKALQHMQEI